MTVARTVRFDISKDKKADFTKLFSAEVMPLLKKQEGFKDEILLVNDEHILGISLWNSADAMKKYQTSTFPKVEQTLAKYSTSKLTIETFVLESAPSSGAVHVTA